ncbi:unnamed protein product [Staurois parvus]|uniref:Uncharacterized protein n=1 Tax=Staurois parvus TaxID=386267 RepID=A0ABN9CNS3_9NEOB|nr:unnamed protein product [Staurois parvus]
MICCPCHLATPPGSLNSSASSPLIGHRNCSSGEAHRRPITGEEVELGEEEPSSSTCRSKKIEGAAGASEERGQRRKTADRGRERASPGWSRGQQGKYHWCQWEE